MRLHRRTNTTKTFPLRHHFCASCRLELCNTFRTEINLNYIRRFSFSLTENKRILQYKDLPVNTVRENNGRSENHARYVDTHCHHYSVFMNVTARGMCSYHKVLHG